MGVHQGFITLLLYVSNTKSVGATVGKCQFSDSTLTLRRLTDVIAISQRMPRFFETGYEIVSSTHAADCTPIVHKRQRLDAHVLVALAASGC
jgi:hypothetical protein